jgi:dUTP pyrophosphatase
MKLLFKKLHPNAKLPSFAHHDDAGMDIHLVEDLTLLPGLATKVPIGLAAHIPEDCVGLIWDKSSIGSKGVRNLGGVIDAGYRGELTLILINLTKEPITFSAGQKIAQMLIQRVEHPEIIETDNLEESKRGAGAFGSTGTH